MLRFWEYFTLKEVGDEEEKETTDLTELGSESLLIIYVGQCLDYRKKQWNTKSKGSPEDSYAWVEWVTRI